jgi:long-chain acyl-CoA synthetase
MTWPPDLPRSLTYPAVAVGSILDAAARRYGARVVFQHDAESLSFNDLADRAHRFAAALAGRGIGRGDRVALVMPNCLAYPVAYFGIQFAGATFVPVNPLLPDTARNAQLRDAEVALTVTASMVDTMVDAETSGLGQVPVDLDNDLAHLAYTGGTTGVSKGVRLPIRNVVVNTLQNTCWRVGALPVLDEHGDVTLDQIGAPDEWPSRLGTDVSINLTPWFHAMGTIAGLNGPIMAGATLHLQSRLDPIHYLAEAERLQVSSIGGAPALVAALLATGRMGDYDLSAVRSVSTGAAPLSLDTIEQLQRILPGVKVIEGYGLTEVTMGATGNPAFNSGVRKAGTVGLPTFDTELKVVAEDSEEPLPTGERGEVCIRGPQVMTGYHNRPEATAEVLVDGWLHTGDIGVLDADGYLSIVDRKKDLVLYKGYNVYPRELEELLLALPSVQAAAVVGKPDELAGELPVAFVVPAAADIDREAVMAAVNEQVVHYKRLRDLRVVDTIPVSAAGKILKRELRATLTS